MVEQLTLPAARATDPETSHAAAAAVPSGVVEAAVMRVFVRKFSTYGCGMTDDELVAALPEHHGPTVKSARSRLSKSGRLVNSGCTALSNRGRASIVWRLP